MASTVVSTTSYSRFAFNSGVPAKSSSTANFRANSVPATVAASSSAKDEILGRRGLLFTLTATLPLLLLPFSESVEAFTAKAVEPIYEVMKEQIRKVVSKGKAAGVLRFVFHDAGTYQLDDNSGGMNGSVIYELDRPENKGLKTPFKYYRLTPG